MKKIIMCLAIIITVISSTVSAENLRWKPLDDNLDTYWDMQTAKYNSNNNTITFWIKEMDDDKLFSMEQCIVDLKSCKYATICLVMYENGTPTVRTYEYVKPLKEICPDGVIEKISNQVCDLYHLKHMHKDEDRWRYLYDDGKYIIYYAPEWISVNNRDMTVMLWVHKVSKDGTESIPYKWICNFKNNVIEYMGAQFPIKRYVVPDTLEEVIWNKASTYIKS